MKQLENITLQTEELRVEVKVHKSKTPRSLCDPVETCDFIKSSLNLSLSCTSVYKHEFQE